MDSVVPHPVVQHGGGRQFRTYNVMVIFAMSFASIAMGYSANIISTTLAQPTFVAYFELDTRQNGTQLISGMNGLYKFPIPANDCYDAVKWAAANSKVHGGDLSKGFIVSGVSAGANMACSVAHLARDENLSPPLTGVYLNIPSLLAPQAVPDKLKSTYTSRDENKDAPILNSGAIALFRKLYEDDPLSPLMSPAVWPSGHKDLPPTYLQVAGMDPLRDEGLIYEEMLKEAGVSTRIDVYPGLPHGFSSWWPKAEFSVKQRKDTAEGLQWLLEAGSGK